MIALVAASLLIRATPQDTSLRAEVERIAAASGARMGVAAVRVETGETLLSLRGGEGFPMQSVFKIPLAITLLRRVDAGELRLDATVPVTAADLRAGVSPVDERWPNGGGRYTVRELLRLAAGESDNTAADLLLRLAGGPAAVTRTVRALGIAGIRVDRGEGRLALDFRGVPYAPGRETKRVSDSLAAYLTPARRQAAFEAYLRDPRDTATPEGMARLLVLLARGRLLSPASNALLMEILTRTQTGPHRLRGLLPPGTPVAHKTGMSGSVGGVTGVVNDVGVVTLPDGSRVAIAVFAMRCTRGTEAAERAIALVSKAVYDRATRPRHPRRPLIPIPPPEIPRPCAAHRRTSASASPRPRCWPPPRSRPAPAPASATSRGCRWSSRAAPWTPRSATSRR